MSVRRDAHVSGEGVGHTVRDRAVQVVEVWEHQRYYPIKGWSSSLLPTDRARWSSLDGSRKFGSLADVPHSGGWNWVDGSVWAVDKESSEDKDGWFYATDFVGPAASWKPKKMVTAFVRRRRHVRQEWRHIAEVVAVHGSLQNTAVLERDRLCTPYGSPASALEIRCTDGVLSQGGDGKPNVEFRLSWATRKSDDAEGTTGVIKVGDSGSNVKIVDLPREGLTVDPAPINRQDPSWTDAFATDVQGNKLHVTRIDAQGGWGQKLELMYRVETALSAVLRDMYWSVTRSWESLKWLEKKLKSCGVKPAPLPTSGAANWLASKLGSSSAQKSDAEMLVRELPKWLNKCLADPSIVTNPYLKLFLDPDVPDLDDVEKYISGKAKTLLPAVEDAIARISQSASAGPSIWLQLYFERAMIKASASSVTNKEKFERQQKLQIRAAAQSARSVQVTEMTARLNLRPTGCNTRSANHDDRASREGSRLKLQQSTQFVATIDRTEDDKVRLADAATSAQDRTAFETDCATFSNFERQHTFETAEWAAADSQIRASTGLINPLHSWILAHMLVEVQLPQPADFSLSEDPKLKVQGNALARVNAELMQARATMSAVNDTTADTDGMRRELDVHTHEANKAFPEIRNLIVAETAAWTAEDEALARESAIRLEERRLYTAKVDEQEKPLLDVLAQQKVRLSTMRQFLADVQQRQSNREYHMTTSAAIRQQSAGRQPSRLARNQQRDQIYRAACERHAAQAANPDRLFYPNDIGPIPVPNDFVENQKLLSTMTGVNTADLEALSAARATAATYHADMSTAEKSVDGWYKYQQSVADAEVSGPLDFLDRDFLARLARHAEMYETHKPIETDLLGQVDAALQLEETQVGSPPAVSSELNESASQLQAEAPFDADEHQRNQGIADTIASEIGNRAAKESAMAQQVDTAMANMVTVSTDMQDQLEKLRKCMANSDVQVFLNLESHSWLGGLSNRFDHTLRHDAETARRLTAESSRRRPPSISRAEESRHEGERLKKRLRQIEEQLKKSKRGERALRATLSAAERASNSAKATLTATPLYVSPPADPRDSWLIAHIAKQANLAAQHASASQLTSAVESEVQRHMASSVINQLAKLFSPGDDLLQRLRDALRELFRTLDDEVRRAKEVQHRDPGMGGQ